MVKTVPFTLNDEDYFKLKIKKGKQTWHDFVIKPLLQDSSYDHNIKKLLRGKP